MSKVFFFAEDLLRDGHGVGACLRLREPVYIRRKEIDSAVLDLDLGAACDLPGGSRLSFGITEDVISRAGPDFTVFATWTVGL